ncbi:MAG: hypothetical protein FWH17_04775 [Oscillospiraceae bacterium]|nr:hypothetical protein [Oscillospiraceae bacterium]
MRKILAIAALCVVFLILTALFITLLNSDKRIKLNGIYVAYNFDGEVPEAYHLFFDDNNLVFIKDGEKVFTVQYEAIESNLRLFGYTKAYYDILVAKGVAPPDRVYAYLPHNSRKLAFYDQDTDTIVFVFNNMLKFSKVR